MHTSPTSLSKSSRYCPQWVFGPVKSRRLGLSLGIDCVPFKTCNYNCVYCELGNAGVLTNSLDDHAPVADILDELKDRLAAISRPDYVTLAGAGEPTLYRRLAELIRGIKDLTDIPVALLTNGALFSRKEIRLAARSCDLVIPSLDAGNDSAFRAVNRPHPDIRYRDVVKGMCQFREEFAGPIWLEVCLVDGINTDSGLRELRQSIERIAPDLIQLNTVDRPPAEAFARAAAPARMREIADFLGDRAQII